MNVLPIDTWTKLIVVITAAALCCLFVFQIGYFSFVGIELFGLFSTDLWSNAIFIVPAILFSATGFVYVGENTFASILILQDTLMETHRGKIVLLVIAGLISIIAIFYLFRDAIVGVFLIPFSGVAVVSLFELTYRFRKGIGPSYSLVSLIISILVVICVSGWLTARHAACCASSLYDIKMKDLVVHGARIMRVNDTGLIYVLNHSVVYLPRTQFVQVSRNTNE